MRDDAPPPQRRLAKLTGRVVMLGFVSIGKGPPAALA